MENDFIKAVLTEWIQMKSALRSLVTTFHRMADNQKLLDLQFQELCKNLVDISSLRVRLSSECLELNSEVVRLQGFMNKQQEIFINALCQPKIEQSATEGQIQNEVKFENSPTRSSFLMSDGAWRSLLAGVLLGSFDSTTSGASLQSDQSIKSQNDSTNDSLLSCLSSQNKTGLFRWTDPQQQHSQLSSSTDATSSGGAISFSSPPSETGDVSSIRNDETTTTIGNSNSFPSASTRPFDSALVVEVLSASQTKSFTPSFPPAQIPHGHRNNNNPNNNPLILNTSCGMPWRRGSSHLTPATPSNSISSSTDPSTPVVIKTIMPSTYPPSRKSNRAKNESASQYVPVDAAPLSVPRSSARPSAVAQSNPLKETSQVASGITSSSLSTSKKAGKNFYSLVNVPCQQPLPVVMKAKLMTLQGMLKAPGVPPEAVQFMTDILSGGAPAGFVSSQPSSSSAVSKSVGVSETASAENNNSSCSVLKGDSHKENTSSSEVESDSEPEAARGRCNEVTSPSSLIQNISSNTSESENRVESQTPNHVSSTSSPQSEQQTSSPNELLQQSVPMTNAPSLLKSSSQNIKNNDQHEDDKLIHRPNNKRRAIVGDSDEDSSVVGGKRRKDVSSSSTVDSQRRKSNEENNWPKTRTTKVVHASN